MAEDRTTPEHASVDQAKAAAKVQPSGPRGDNPATAGPGNVGIRSATPENAGGEINPSAPADTGITPGSDPE